MDIALRLAVMVLAVGFGSGAMAATTRLVACGDQPCLLIHGQRQQRDEPVVINGRTVAVEGGRSWHLRLPMATLRAWSAPYARSLAIATGQNQSEASLPIGLLGHTTDLAALEVRAR
jgi:hypothetical protein